MSTPIAACTTAAIHSSPNPLRSKQGTRPSPAFNVDCSSFRTAIRSSQPPPLLFNHIRAAFSLSHSRRSRLRRRWVRAEGYAAQYTGKSCAYAGKTRNCEKNGQTSFDYRNYKWVPGQPECSLSRFDAASFLSLLRGKVVAMAGDSMINNLFEAIRCLVSATTPAPGFLLLRSRGSRLAFHNVKVYTIIAYRVLHSPPPSSSFFHSFSLNPSSPPVRASLRQDWEGTFPGVTGDYEVFEVPKYGSKFIRIQDPFLVDSKPQGTSDSSSATWTINLDKPSPLWVSLLKTADVLVFAHGHWFDNVSATLLALLPLLPLLARCTVSHLMPLVVYCSLHPFLLFHRSLKPLSLSFSSISPDPALPPPQAPASKRLLYQKGQPVQADQFEAARLSLITVASYITKSNYKGQVFYLTYSPRHYSSAFKTKGMGCAKATAPFTPSEGDYAKGKSKEAPYLTAQKAALKPYPAVRVLDIFRMALLRPDAHVGPWDGKSGNGDDCSHWCEPGLPDIWADLLFNELRNGGGAGDGNEISQQDKSGTSSTTSKSNSKSPPPSSSSKSSSSSSPSSSSSKPSSSSSSSSKPSSSSSSSSSKPSSSSSSSKPSSSSSSSKSSSSSSSTSKSTPPPLAPSPAKPASASSKLGNTKGNKRLDTTKSSSAGNKRATGSKHSLAPPKPASTSSKSSSTKSSTKSKKRLKTTKSSAGHKGAAESKQSKTTKSSSAERKRAADSKH
ncbi:unnamed protein product [Closterium sp. NIES-54]